MTPLNYNHLYYFFNVANEGTITKASEKLHLTPQTISGQLSSFESQIGVDLFERQGKKLLLNEVGKAVYEYAENIFQLGEEIEVVLKNQQPHHWLTFNVGVTGVIPKVLAFQLLNPVLNMDKPVRLTCFEGDQESLLAELAINKLDLVLTDQRLQQGSHIKAFNHRLTESGFTFFATTKLAKRCKENFPYSLSGKPFLLQSKNTAVRQRMTSWFEKYDINPEIVAEFDDSALMKSFGQGGYGVFTAPTLIETTIVNQYSVEIIGRTSEFKEHYYIISPERKLKHPAILEIVKSAS